RSRSCAGRRRFRGRSSLSTPSRCADRDASALQLLADVWPGDQLDKPTPMVLKPPKVLAAEGGAGGLQRLLQKGDGVGVIVERQLEHRVPALPARERLEAGDLDNGPVLGHHGLSSVPVQGSKIVVRGCSSDAAEGCTWSGSASVARFLFLPPPRC